MASGMSKVRVAQRFVPSSAAVAVAKALGQRVTPVLEERVFIKNGRRIASTLARVR